MSLYNMLFGVNPASGVILATLGLKPDEVGRFRDCFISDGQIAVYTRNGGGNRRCSHAEDPEDGHQRCQHHVVNKEVDEYEKVDLGGGYTFKATGRRVIEPRYVCEQPDSEHCACTGCTIEHRLPKHPLYVRDVDDEYDCTYATIYFRFPEEYAEDLRKLDTGEPFEPSKRWTEMLEAIRKATP